AARQRRRFAAIRAMCAGLILSQDITAPDGRQAGAGIFERLPTTLGRSSRKRLQLFQQIGEWQLWEIFWQPIGFGDRTRQRSCIACNFRKFLRQRFWWL
ncbi:MAG: hypothetical protein ACRCWO_13935, partial [Bosea sp. (in: a-proteobacteria)]